jgi:hypothetical protein
MGVRNCAEVGDNLHKIITRLLIIDSHIKSALAVYDNKGTRDFLFARIDSNCPILDKDLILAFFSFSSIDSITLGFG